MKAFHLNFCTPWLALFAIVLIAGSSVGYSQHISERATQSAHPKTAVEWCALARDYAAQGEALRKSRIVSDLTTAERDAIGGIYHNWMSAAEQAVALDPKYEDAWYELSSAALFNDDKVRAGIAFWKAQALDQHDYRVYWWGLEMFQPKWGGDSASLHKVARICTTVDFPIDSQVYTLAIELASAGFKAESKVMIQKAITRARASVHDHPTNAALHAALGRMLYEQKMTDLAIPELNDATRLDPNLDKPHLQLGAIYADRHSYAKAAAQFREVVRITGMFDAKVNLASALTNSGQWDDAEKLLKELVASTPGEERPWYMLGQVCEHKQEVDAAIANFEKAEQISSDALEPHRELSLLYAQTNHVDKAVEEAEQAVRLGPEDYNSALYLARAYVLKHEDESGVQAYRRAIELNPRVVEAHLELGNLLLKSGKKSEGRAELKQVIELKPGTGARKAAQEMLDKNP